MSIIACQLKTHRLELLQQLLPIVDRGGHVVSEYIILPPFLSPLSGTRSLLLPRSLTPFGSLPLALSLFHFRLVRPSRPDDAVYVVTRYGAARNVQRSLDGGNFSHSMSLRQHERAINTRYRPETTARPFGKSVFNSTVSLPVSNAHNIRHDRSRS